MRVCNATLEHLKVDEIPYLFNNRYTFHEVGLVICAIFGLLTILIAGWLIMQHARHYSAPQEQRHTMRILMMMPIYAIVAFLSYYYYTKAIYFDVLGDCWEAFAIASFFTLMCNYLRPNLHDQKLFFRERPPPKNWIWPINWMQKCTGGENKGPFRKPRSSLTWFNVIYLCIFQYCFIRVFFTIISVITEAADRYCEDSLNPAFAHVWVTGFEGGSVTIAMYGLIQFYYELRGDLARHKPFLKLLCIKLVIFLSFWQTLIISFLASSSIIEPGPRVGYQDIQVGIPALLLCVEMAIFALLHLWAFPWRHPYGSKAELDEHVALQDPAVVGSGGSKRSDLESSNGTMPPPLPNQAKMSRKERNAQPQPEYHGGRFGLKALANALNPWDIIKQTGRGFRWGFVGARKRNQDINLPMHAQATPQVGSNEDDHLPPMPLTDETDYTGAYSGGNTYSGATFSSPPPQHEMPNGEVGHSAYPTYPQAHLGLPPPYQVSPNLSAEDDAFSGEISDLGFDSPAGRRSAELHMPTMPGDDYDDRKGLLGNAAPMR